MRLIMASTESDDKLLCDKSMVSIDTCALLTLLLENLENFSKLSSFIQEFDKSNFSQRLLVDFKRKKLRV